MARFRRKTCITLIGLILCTFLIMIFLKSLRPEGTSFGNPFGLGLFPHLSRLESGKTQIHIQEDTAATRGGSTNIHKNTARGGMHFEAKPEDLPVPNYNLHVFYYNWYGNPQFDGKYIHWDHPLLPHWDSKVASSFPRGRHSPPDDIGSNFYPELGAYSSRDPSVIEAHVLQLRTAAVGVLALSWYPPGMKDDNGEPTDDLVLLIMDIAHKYQVKVTFHIEPYKGRDDLSMFNNIKYIVEKYGDHPAFYRYKTNTGLLHPLFYVYDSYLISPEMWARLLKDTGQHSIRNTPYDGIFIGLLVEERHKTGILTAGFDGMYTYFATNGFSYGSSHRNWKSIKRFCDSKNLMFIPSVGPGYIDTSIRPWNFHNTRHRINGKYYETAFSAALEARTDIVSITSFNEWHEGTQIEKAVPKTSALNTYQDYLPHKPSIYLDITRKWAERFTKEREKWLI